LRSLLQPISSLNNEVNNFNIGNMIFPKTIITENGTLPTKVNQFMIFKSTEASNVHITDPEAASIFIQDSYRAAVYSSFYHDFKKANLKLKGDNSKPGTFFY
jgi:hypothetical protein